MNESDKDYCVKGVAFRRMSKAATAVEANLNQNAEMTRAERPAILGLPTHDLNRDGEIRESIPQEDLENMDNN